MTITAPIQVPITVIDPVVIAGSGSPINVGASQTSVAVNTAIPVLPVRIINQTGPPGPIGPQGIAGTGGGGSGSVGLQGPPGIAGDDGEPGWPGPAGAAGLQGPQGISGTAGAPGSIGAPGPSGVPGQPGEDGQDAWPIPGPIGPAGVQGGVGAQGLPGIQGLQGVPGIFLPAEDGDDGFMGPPGVPGPIGPQGTAGISGSGSAGSSGYNFSSIADDSDPEWFSIPPASNPGLKYLYYTVTGPSSYFEILLPSGAGLFFGDSVSDPTNYFENTAHQFHSIGDVIHFATIDANGFSSALGLHITGGTSALPAGTTIGGTVPNLTPKCGFQAHCSTNPAITTLAVVPFNTADFDIGSHFNSGSNSWTPPAGLVSLNVSLTGNTGGSAQIALDILKDSTIIATVATGTTIAATIGPSLSIIDQASGSNVYTIKLSSSAAYTMVGASCKFSGALLAV